MKNTLKTLVSILLVFSMIMSLGVVASASTYETSSKTFLYVATNGSDRNDGSFDAPFKTIEKARDTLRAMKKAGTIGEEGAVVYIRGGKYSVFKSITFTAEDSGTKEAPITYRAYPGETVNFFGGIDVDASALQPVTDETVLNRLVDPNAREKLVYIDLRALGMTEMPEPELRGAYTYTYGMADLYGHGAPDATASELIVNGKGQSISRYPNTGWLEIASVLANGAIPRNWADDMKGTAEYVEPSLRKNDPFEIVIEDSRITKWEKAKDIILYGTFYHTWADQSVYVDKINPVTYAVRTTHPSCYGVLKGQTVYFYNLLEEIDIPGEYYIDRDSGYLYYYPLNEEIETIQLTTLDQPMFRLSGCQYITLKNLNMSFMRSYAILMGSCKNVVLDGLDITYTGRMAIQGEACTDMVVKNSYLHDVNGGLTLRNGTPDWVNLVPGNNYVYNNEFEACDRIKKTYNHALNMSGVGCYAYFNEIHNADHLVAAMTGNDMEFAYNEVYDACKRADDMGAYYTGRSFSTRGNRIYFNHFYDIRTEEEVVDGEGVHALYFDDSQPGYYVQGNVFSDCEDGSVYTAGSYTVVSQNIFIDHDNEAISLFFPYQYGATSSSSEYWASIENFQKNEKLWLERYPEMVDMVDEKTDIWNRGNYMVASKNVVVNCPAGLSMDDKVKPTALVEGNVTYKEDPGFYDMANGNYLLKEDSKVYEDIPDFNKIPFTRIGRYSERALNRVKDSAVFSTQSPLSIIKGEVKEDVKSKFMDDICFVNLRTLADVIEGNVIVDEETGDITILTDTTSIEIKAGETNKIVVNGVEIELEFGIKNIDGSNYISINDFAKATGRGVLVFDNIYVFAEVEDLLDAEGDKELITYYKDILSIY